MCAKNHLLIFSSFIDIWENVEWPRFFWTTLYMHGHLMYRTGRLALYNIREGQIKIKRNKIITAERNIQLQKESSVPGMKKLQYVKAMLIRTKKLVEFGCARLATICAVPEVERWRWV